MFSCTQFRLWPRTDKRRIKITVRMKSTAAEIPLTRMVSSSSQTWLASCSDKIRSNHYFVHISTCILENILDRLDVKEGNLNSRLSVKFRCLDRSVGGRKISAAEVVSRRRQTLCKPLKRPINARRLKIATNKNRRL